MLKKTSELVFALVCLVLSAACYSIDYKGKSDSPLPSDVPVVMYYSPQQIPVKNYTVLGEATADAGTTWTAAQLEAKIKNFARSKGANGVLIVSVDKIPEGEARPDQVRNRQAMSWVVDDSSYNSFRYFREDMLDYGKPLRGEEEVYDLKIKAKLLVVPQKPK